MRYLKGLAIFAFVAAAPLAVVRGDQEHAHPGHDASSAYGELGDINQPSRLVPVSMREGDGRMLFTPDTVTVRRGEQIHFQLSNDGELEHEFVLGTARELEQHVEKMKARAKRHDDPNAVFLAPKAGGDLVWKFTEAGVFEFVCLIPGHLEAGMKGKIVVK